MPDSADQLAKALDARIVLTIELVFIQGKYNKKLLKTEIYLNFLRKLVEFLQTSKSSRIKQ